MSRVPSLPWDRVVLRSLQVSAEEPSPVTVGRNYLTLEFESVHARHSYIENQARCIGYLLRI